MPVENAEGSSIVCSDDFEDGDTAGWVAGEAAVGDEFYVKDGVLSFGLTGGDIEHASKVTTGTWSLDIFLPDKGGTIHLIGLMAEVFDEESNEWEGIWLTIENQPFTNIALHHWTGGSDNLLDHVSIIGEEIIKGWHHVDVTRDDAGMLNIYFNGK